MRGRLPEYDRIYAALLHVYPQKFRAAYGQQMRLTFRDACRTAYQRNGLAGLLALWLPTLLDLFISALEEQAQQGVHSMSKAKIISLAGPLTILVGVLWFLGAFADIPFRIGQARDEGFWDTFLVIWSFAFILSFIPLLIALIGIRLRFRQAAGKLGRLGQALSVAGVAGVIVSMLANLLLNAVAPEPEAGAIPWIGYAAVASLWCVWIGLILFGVNAMRYRLLPRWNLLPLLMGLTILLSFGFDWFGVPAFLPVQWVTPTLYFSFNGICLVLLGFVMMRQNREPLIAV